MGRFRDLSGQRFGRLTVIERAENMGSATRWKCLCDCGKESIAHAGSIVDGGTKSCGCLRLERWLESALDHGMSNSLEYSSWHSMKRRCLDPSHTAFKFYGGRGIKICPQWIGENGFANFLNDMGKRPDSSYSLDRINSQGDYEPSNCRWASRTTQARNTRSNKLLTMNGKTQCLKAWSEELGIGAKTITCRLDRGWTVERALTQPVQPQRGKPGGCK